MDGGDAQQHGEDDGCEEELEEQIREHTAALKDIDEAIALDEAAEELLEVRSWAAVLTASPRVLAPPQLASTPPPSTLRTPCR
jgi:hypothetical protein